MVDMSSPVGGSSLDVTGIVNQLVHAEIDPVVKKLDLREASLTTKLSAVGQIKSALSKLQNIMAKLSDINQFNSLAANVSDPTAFSAALVGNKATTGNYQLMVQQLATNHSLASAPFPDTTSSIGNGTIQIDFGTYSAGETVFTNNPSINSLTVTIQPGQDSLTAIRDAINNSTSAVKASIINDNSGARLAIVSTQSGQSAAMKITVTDNDGNNTDAAGLSALAYDPTSSITSMTETIAALDSQVSINGLLINQSSNTLNGVIEGVTINLLKAQVGVPVMLNITDNQGSASTLVNEFITTYNETINTINSLTSYDVATKKAGALQGDPNIRDLKYALSSLISKPISNPNSPFQSLGDIGVKTDAIKSIDGTLLLDTAVFNAAVQTNYQAIGLLFGKSASITDPSIRLNQLGVDVPPGTYNIDLQSFIPGTSLDGSIGGVSGVSTDAVTLQAQGNLSGLSIDILAGSAGSRGTITVTDGIGVIFNNLITSFLGADGEIGGATTNIDNGMKQIDNQRNDLQDRATKLYDRYKKQFTVLDAMLTRMQSTMSFLSQQLDNLPSSSPKRK